MPISEPAKRDLCRAYFAGGDFISWKYFTRAMDDATDNVNVAIHEMAHALEHENFIDETMLIAGLRRLTSPNFHWSAVLYLPMLSSTAEAICVIMPLPICRILG
jgi:hypothetical protein